MLRAARRLLSKVQTGKQRRGFTRSHLSFDSKDYAAVYAVGDIHGCYEQLRAAYAAIEKDAAVIGGRSLVIFLGDYVDRGLHSKSVMNFLCSRSSSSFESVFLCGNHDEEFLQFCLNPSRKLAWLDFGGRETLMSYGIDADHILKSAGGAQGLAQAVRQVIPDQHIEFLKGLPILARVDDVVFVHAGIRPSVPLNEQSDYDLTWIREPFLSKGPGFEFTVVHGHTVTMEPSFGRQRIGIDTGVYETGRLTVLKLSNGEASFVDTNRVSS